MTAAVLYVCVERVPGSTLAQERARDEGHDLAGKHDLTIVDTITDPYGNPDPQAREGWQRVRDMAARGEITTVIVRWPNAISPDHAQRCVEITALQEYGVRVLFSWAPLATVGAAEDQ